MYIYVNIHINIHLKVYKFYVQMFFVCFFLAPDDQYHTESDAVFGAAGTSAVTHQKGVKFKLLKNI